MQGLQGYRAVIEAFNALPKLSKASISAAGRVEAAKVFVIGAGVAGLQAVSTAHGLGAQVFAHDVRSATREEVESCGGKFIGLRMVRGFVVATCKYALGRPDIRETRAKCLADMRARWANHTRELSAR